MAGFSDTGAPKIDILQKFFFHMKENQILHILRIRTPMIRFRLRGENGKRKISPESSTQFSLGLRQKFKLWAAQFYRDFNDVVIFMGFILLKVVVCEKIALKGPSVAKKGQFFPF